MFDFFFSVFRNGGIHSFLRIIARSQPSKQLDNGAMVLNIKAIFERNYSCHE